MEHEQFLSEYFPFWHDLSKEEKKALCTDTKEVRYEKGQTVHDGNECTGAIIVKKGSLRTYILSEDGKEITLYRLYEGEISVLSASCALRAITFDVMVEADDETECLLIGSNTFGKLIESNMHAKNYALELATARFSEVMWVFQQILFMSFDKRLAIFLLDESAKRQSSTLKITHEQIAKYTGSAREVVTRMLKQFSKEGIVESGRGDIHILNKSKLRDLLR